MTGPRSLYAALTVCGLLLLAVAIIFSQTVRYNFVNFDDNQYVYDNPQVANGLTIEGIVWAFTTTHANNWHPLTWLSHMLDCQFYGLAPGGHHLTNVLLHAATAILLFLVLWRMTGDLWPSAFVAAVFAIHPLRVESVAWVSERKDVLSGLFFMLTLGAYVGYVRRPFSPLRYLAVVALLALGLMAKPMLVTLPFVLLLLDYWPLRRLIPPWRLVVEKLPLLALSAASCVATPLAQSEAVERLEILPLGSRMANAVVSYAAYLGQLFYPAGLAAFYPHPENGLPLWQVAGAVLLLAGITAGVAACWRRCPSLPVGWFWYVGMLVPVIGLVQVGEQSMADRYTYLPQIGLAIALAWGAKQVLGAWPPRALVCGVGFAVILGVLMGCASQQACYWRNSETLWRRDLDCTSHNALAHYNLGLALADGGRVDEAIVQFKKALAIKPDYVAAMNNLGVALCDQGRVVEAIAQYRNALSIRPDYAMAHVNLGIAYTKQKSFVAAMAEYNSALEFQPDYPEARYNLGMLLYQCGRIPEAITQWAEMIRWQPDNTLALNRIARALAASPEASIRDGPHALELAQRAATLTGGRDPMILDTLAAAYAESGRFSEAVQTAEHALALASDQKNAPLTDALRARIKLYQSRSPYRDIPRLSVPPSGRP